MAGFEGWEVAREWKLIWVMPYNEKTKGNRKEINVCKRIISLAVSDLWMDLNPRCGRKRQCLHAWGHLWIASAHICDILILKSTSKGQLRLRSYVYLPKQRQVLYFFLHAGTVRCDSSRSILSPLQSDGHLAMMAFPTSLFPSVCNACICVLQNRETFCLKFLTC